MNLIGRERERQILTDCLRSQRPEFVAVYGRRRVGKTFLLKEFFNNRFTFYATGIAEGKTRDQLRAFNDSLLEYGCDRTDMPKDWFDAFSRLRELITAGKARRDPASDKIVIFLDELPWMNTARSNFKGAMDYFWNGWASTRSDLVLIVCGSATSWIIDNLVHDTGGFYNRITRQIHLLPFTLKECEDYFKANEVMMTRPQIIESYMVFGGIPYYLSNFDSRLSLAQNIEQLCFKEYGQLRSEYHMLFKSLFKNPDKHIAIIQALARNKSGMTRTDLAKIKTIGDGEPLTKSLNELEQCGFIRKYQSFVTSKQGGVFQLIDPFVLFSLNFMQNRKSDSWLTYIDSPGYYAWCGNAFEIVCLNHISQIKHALGINGVGSSNYAWRSRSGKGGAQIDLLIDRRDDVINVCEVKHSKSEYAISESFRKEMLRKMEVFREETGTKKALHITLISASGVRGNERYGLVQNIVCGDDLFAV